MTTWAKDLCPHCRLRKRTCRSCGAPILWAETSAGRRIPLDLRQTSIAVSEATPASPARVRIDRGHVPHFGTCPQATLWSRQGRPPEAPTTPGVPLVDPALATTRGEV